MEAAIQQFLVIDVAFFHVEHALEGIGGINRVAHPRDVSEEIFLAFIHLHIHVHMLRVHRPHAVFHNHGIAEAHFIVLIQEAFLGLFPTLGREFLGLEKGGELAGLVHFPQRAFFEQSALDFLVGELVVALDDDAAHLHFLLFVDDDIENHLVFLGHVVALHHVDFSVLEALVVEIFLSEQLGTVEHVGMDAHAAGEAEFLLKVVALRLLDAHVVDLRHARPSGQCHVQIDAVAHDGIGGNRHLGEESVAPVALHGIGDLRARHFDFLSYGEARDACDGIVFVAVHARDVDASEDVGARRAGIGDVGVFDDILGSQSEK